MDIKGTVIEVGAIEQVTETFSKRVLVLEYAENPTYPEYLKIEAANDRAALLDGIQPGDEVEVGINLSGRAYTTKAGKQDYFNSIKLWKITVLASGGGQAPQEQSESAEEDDLPF